MAPEYLPEQGRRGLTILPPLNNDHLARDNEVDQEVVLFVYGPGGGTTSPRDLRWSLAWQVSNGGWKHIHVTAENTPYDRHLPWRYVYWGPQTKTAGLATYQARKTSLGVMNSATRKRIEAIAWEVGVAKPDGQWNCQHWILALLGKLYENRVINQAQWSKAIADASHRMCWSLDSYSIDH